jgi:hypothetical protein
MPRIAVAVLTLLVHTVPVHAEVTGVTVTSRTPIASGQSFGAAGAYEKIVGRIEFALDPADPHNRGIVDLSLAPREPDGRVHFSSDLHVLRPVDPSKGNGVLLFEAANRGRRGLLGRFNRAVGTGDPTADDVGDGLLMRDGYTLVWIGWEIDVAAPLLRLDAPPARLPAGSDDRLSVEIMHNQPVPEVFLVDDPAGRPPVIYAPAERDNPTDALTVRDRFWDTGEVIPRERWRFVDGPDHLPKLRLDTGFEPGRYYRVTYRPAGALVSGVGLAAIRDAAAAFRYRSDLPIHGERTYAFGVSQAGRFLRQFLYEGFNADERDRRVFDAMWIHVAGAARVGFNERFATETLAELFTATRFPFADVEQRDADGRRDGLLARYRPDQRPKIFYTNTPVEYWGGGRAAALTHTTIDGTRDLELPGHVRMYFLAGTQHIVPPFPPVRTPPVAGAGTPAAARSGGQQLNNPTPQNNVMRALLRAWHAWATGAAAPPPSQYPRLRDGTLARIDRVRCPALAGVADPRRIVGPGRLLDGKPVPLPHLVPQVDRDGNDLGGIRDPEVAVPLATTTGWNFRDPSVGNPQDIYQLLGSYIPFAPTEAARHAWGDPRASIEGRYRGVEDYVERIRHAAKDLIRRRFLLAEDLDGVVERARRHWAFATGASGQGSAARPSGDAQGPPPRGPRTPVETCALHGPLAHVRSAATPAGVPVRMSPPTEARYADGAPIAVQVTPVPSLDEARACLKDEGFVDVGFHCPGDGVQAAGGWERSGGKPGPEACAEALADVLAFVTGRTRSLEGESIQDYLGAIKASTRNVGLIGWSAGGNLATLTMARHGERFRDLAWYASWESPVLSTVDIGTGSIFEANRFYDPATGRVEWTRLRYSPEMPLWVWPPQGVRADPNWPRGGLYLDGNGDGVFSRDTDYAFWLKYGSLTAGGPEKAFYPLPIIREARARHVFGPAWPAHIASVDDVQRRENVDGVMPRIADAVRRLPRLAVLVFESERGHVTNSVDHPHAIAQVDAWLDAGVRWVRLNPDAHYVGAVMGGPPSRTVQNPAGRRVDRASIATLVEAEADAGGPTDAQGMTAAALELADRTHDQAWTPVLNEVLVRRR